MRGGRVEMAQQMLGEESAIRRFNRLVGGAAERASDT
jgi:hypothetical protein